MSRPSNKAPPVKPPEEQEPPDAPSSHATAQARYRAKYGEINIETERVKARERMRKLRASKRTSQLRKPRRKQARQKSDLPSGSPASVSSELHHFKEFVDALVPNYLQYNPSDPEEARWYEDVLSDNPSNPSTMDLPPCGEDMLSVLFERREELFPGWRAELDECRARKEGMSEADLNACQQEFRSKQEFAEMIYGRGGFCTDSEFAISLRMG
ncbi:hypothetical protein B0H14DRAFT_3522244 [Mycena olivaceomarginata]|nr:hypothetical protein B0H14DRAFT_3522244 [Mycena olivaceomarginata]